MPPTGTGPFDLDDNSNRTLYPRPAQLFSHNDQQSTWQSSSPEGSTMGWGGHIGDRVQASGGLNTNSLFTSISVSGNAVLLSGVNAVQYQASTSGASRSHPPPIKRSTAPAHCPQP